MSVTERTGVDPAGIRRILIRGVNWVGDAVMTTPAIAGIRKTFPRAQISLLVKPWVAGVFAGNPHIDEILIYDGEGRHRGVTGLLQLARELRESRFELAILLQNAFEAALLAFLARIPHRIGYNTQGRGLLLTTAVAQDRSTRKLHYGDYYLALLGALGWAEEKREPSLFLSSQTEERAEALLAEEGVRPQDTLVAFNPGSIYGSARRWPEERFAALADRLVEDLGVKVLLTGAKVDGAVARAVRSYARYPQHVIDLIGRTDIQLLAAVLRRCAVFVTIDTGSMHIGAAVGVPLVAIFGPTNEKTAFPLGRHVLLRHPVPCSPCLLRECPIDHRCMTGISVDRVLSSVIGIYDFKDKVVH